MAWILRSLVLAKRAQRLLHLAKNDRQIKQFHILKQQQSHAKDKQCSFLTYATSSRGRGREHKNKTLLHMIYWGKNESCNLKPDWTKLIVGLQSNNFLNDQDILKANQLSVEQAYKGVSLIKFFSIMKVSNFAKQLKHNS